MPRFDHNECSVRCLQHAGDYTFEEAQAILANFGRKHGRGTPWYIIERAYHKALRLSVHRRYIGKTVYKALKGLPTTGTYIIGVRGHIFTYKDGDIKDWMQNCSRAKIDHLWHVKGRKERGVDKAINAGLELVGTSYKSKNRRLRKICE
jgi:hypothetical protein|tara:strand:- start:1553 stop:1999 length:447 start_codon:yes stop_codon:yes gene_type:complete